ncbi:MAG: hypothetical protein ACM3SS_13770 [Rhodospirillaceae bacterium]
MQITALDTSRPVHIASGDVKMDAALVLPAGATGIVIFAPGTRADSWQYVHVAGAVQAAGLGTLVFDALPSEQRTRLDRFDIPGLVEHLVHATRWVCAEEALRGLRVGYFAAGAASAAALAAAGGLGEKIASVVTRGGRPDFASAHLERITAATLFVVSGADRAMLEVNERAYERLHCTKRLVVVPGALHGSKDSSAAGEVASLATDWFCRHLEAAVRA